MTHTHKNNLLNTGKRSCIFIITLKMRSSPSLREVVAVLQSTERWRHWINWGKRKEITERRHRCRQLIEC